MHVLIWCTHICFQVLFLFIREANTVCSCSYCWEIRTGLLACSNPFHRGHAFMWMTTKVHWRFSPSIFGFVLPITLFDWNPDVCVQVASIPWTTPILNSVFNAKLVHDVGWFLFSFYQATYCGKVKCFYKAKHTRMLHAYMLYTWKTSDMTRIWYVAYLL